MIKSNNPHLAGGEKMMSKKGGWFGILFIPLSSTRLLLASGAAPSTKQSKCPKQSKRKSPQQRELKIKKAMVYNTYM